ncbi:oxamate carbamoyltransferase subunit AllH family protein [Tessaracoccus sp. Y36]
MTVMRALVADREFTSWAANRPRARVHSVFARTVNMIDASGLWTLAAATVPVGPRTAVLDMPSAATLKLAVGDEVDLASVDLRNATTWNSARWPLRITRSAVEVVRAHLPVTNATDPFERAAEGRIATHAVRLQTAVSGGDFTTTKIAAAGLIGLGPGLTPAGDDLLAGFIIGCHVTGRDAALRWLRSAVAEHAAATNDISLTMLTAALDGRATSVLHHLVDALGAGDTDRITAATNQCLAVGHSSGLHIVGGLVAALELTERGHR